MDRCKVYACSDAARTAYVYAGFLALARDGALTVRVALPPAAILSALRRSSNWTRGPAVNLEGMGDVVLAQVTRGDHSQFVAFDTSDHAWTFNRAILEMCSVYAKRSYFEPQIEAAAGEHAHKVVPFGLPMAVRAPSDWSGPLRVAVKRAAIGSLNPAGLRADIGNVRAWIHNSDITGWEVPAAAPREPKVLFQTRLWESSSDPHLDELNQFRIDLARALRAELGRAFVGGVMPTEYARRRCPDVLNEAPDDRGEYRRWMGRFLIGISTEGLHRSTPWKITEYLAQSKCIISEPIRNSAAPPLTPGQEYVSCATLEQFVASARELVADNTLAMQYSSAAQEYYLSHVRPDRCVAGILRQLPEC